MRKILGIDEAGRGPVIGPLVMVGFMVYESEIPRLKELGVKDSKMLTKKERERIYEDLISMGKFTVKVVAPKIIDTFNLNSIERKVAEQIIKEMKPDLAIIDGFEKDLEKKLNVHGVEILAEPKADVKYEVVSAASIIAKVERDRLVDQIKEDYGLEDFGSGYPSDPRTVEFLKKYYLEHGKFPDFVRRSWETARVIEGSLKQRKLTDFWGLEE